MNLSGAPRESRRWPWEPPEISWPWWWFFARWQRPLWQPPEESDANNYGNDAIDQEHPLEADEPAHAVHFLKASRDKTDNGGGKLCGRKVLADSFADTGGRVEERQIVRHPWPHPGYDDTQENAK